MTKKDQPVEPLAYGTARTIGTIELSSSVAFTVESRLAVPDNIVAISSRLRLPRGQVSSAALDEMVSSHELERAAQQVADASAQVVVFACTMGSLLHGRGFDRRLAERIHEYTGVPATSTATEVVRALHRLGARRIAIGTPYVDELNLLEQRFFEAEGFEVVHLEGLQIGDDQAIARLGADEVRSLAESAVRADIDALFLSCTNMPTLPILAELEARFGIPVISSNAATLWGALDAVGSAARSTRLGSLLTSLQEKAPTDLAEVATTGPASGRA